MSRRSEEAQLRKAAERGDMNAAHELGGMLEEDGNVDGGERWFRLAAMAGNRAAAADLGRLLWQRRWFIEAEAWLRKAATSNDPENPLIAQYGAGMLGKCLMDTGRPDEAEQWLVIGADAGLDFAVEALETLRAPRTTGPSGGAGSDVLQTFEVDSVMFYDGVGHRLGPSVCTLTRSRLIIDDARGGISQIRLRDITGVSTPARITVPKQLRITAPGVAYDIYCLSKNQKNDFEAWLSQAIRGA
jgi:hypothetical protein